MGNGRNAAILTALEKEIGPSFCGVAGDASENTVLEQLFDAAKKRFGKPADIVVANAGRGLGGSVKDADLSQFDDLIKINVTGTLALLQKAARKMVDGQQCGYPKAAADIVIVGSVVGRHISPFSAVYGATKFAVHAHGRRAATGGGTERRFASHLVQPGIVLSGFQAVAGYSDEMIRGFHEKFGPLLEGDDVADAIHLRCHPARLMYISATLSSAPHARSIRDVEIQPEK